RVEHALEGVFLQRAAAFDARRASVGKHVAAREHFLVHADDEVEPPFAHQAIAVLDHGRDLECRVDVHERKRHVAEERLAREPEQYRRILADAPQHRRTLEPVESLADDVDALALERGEMIQWGPCAKYKGWRRAPVRALTAA